MSSAYMYRDPELIEADQRKMGRMFQGEEEATSPWECRVVERAKN